MTSTAPVPCTDPVKLKLCLLFAGIVIGSNSSDLNLNDGVPLALNLTITGSAKSLAIVIGIGPLSLGSTTEFPAKIRTLSRLKVNVSLILFMKSLAWLGAFCQYWDPALRIAVAKSTLTTPGCSKSPVNCASNDWPFLIRVIWSALNSTFLATAVVKKLSRSIVETSLLKTFQASTFLTHGAPVTEEAKTEAPSFVGSQ